MNHIKATVPRNRQCKACPWKRSTVPDRDIPNGYSATAHARLECTIARQAQYAMGAMRMMACHESEVGNEFLCIGWVVNQLGPGNNLALRMRASDGRYRDLRTVGPQHERFEDTLPKAVR